MEILLVEDNLGDVRLVAEGLKDSRIRHRLSVAHDGLEALAFLKRHGAHAAAPRPDLIVLDLNLPRKSGHDVLAEIKADAQLRTIPVCVLSSSQSDADVDGSYALHANCYVVKPVDLDQFLGVVQRIEEFWLAIATLPRHTN
jgi:CheY-like chemotaxis protein